MMGIKLGQKVRDVVTGYEGIVTGYVQYLSGCNQALVAAHVGTDGKVPDSMWFDDIRLEVLDVHPVGLPRESVLPTGADKPAPRR